MEGNIWSAGAAFFTVWGENSSMSCQALMTWFWLRACDIGVLHDVAAAHLIGQPGRRCGHCVVPPGVVVHVAEVLKGLGVASIPDQACCDSISGDQLARLSLLWLLLRRPETPLLDEPTNHLDDGAVEILAHTLRDWPGPVLLANHDRWFLDTEISHLIDLDTRPEKHAARTENHGITGVCKFSGTYSEYVAQVELERQRWQEQFQREQN
ncbi:Uncharacterized ABC transporter ATP-binding protein HI_1252 [Dermatophilus congolensis]|uniref:Uncharacterized ABC transporter ATP-binding protein HI_1252 n=1 Tax=Dermatophilus congolensis TaxID=1863 RepID=A0AA46BPX2_9MICO|nr:Uncharacterized ABC transporter ATP-binding protein HI_1252 [Dermatophilus congolensis]